MRGAVTSCGGWGDFRRWPVPAMAKVCLARRKLSEMVSVECDGVDITPKLRQLKVHSVLFLNISCFGSGTRPWDTSKGSQKLDDGLIEVVGLKI